MVHLLTAPAAAGKTQYCIERIQQVRGADPLSPIWVVLPGATQARAFHRRLARAGGAIGVHTVTFYSLYAELLPTAGQFIARLDDPVLHRLLRTIVDDLQARGRLRYYAPLHDKPGFLHVLRTVIQDLKRARVTAQDFVDGVQGHGPRLEELGAIYSRYQQWLYASPWADAEGQGWLAALALEDHPDLCTDWRLLVMDGFDQFNPTQLAVLRRMSDQVQETLITVTGTNPPRLAHHRFNRARTAVEQALGVTALPLPHARVHLAPPLTRLEATLFNPKSETRNPKWGSQAVALGEAPTRAEEVRAALRWLKMRHVHERIPVQEMAILARDLAPYRLFLEETAAEFGLPLRLAQGAWLYENPAIAALLNLLTLPLRNWSRRLVVEAWRSPYFDWSGQGIELGDADLLDAVAQHSQVIAGLEQWSEALERLARAVPKTGKAAAQEESAVAGEDSAEAITSDVPTGPAAAALRAKVEAFIRRLTPPARATFRDYTAWLEALIGDDPDLAPAEQPWKPGDSLGIVARACYGPDTEKMGVRAKHLATAERDVAALRRLKDILRGLVFAESALGKSSPVSYARFWQELQGAVEATTDQVPALGDQSTLLAASVLAARGLSFRAVALLGLSEGEFPRPPQQDPLLRESDREVLRKAGVGLELRVQGDEATIFYEAVTRATEQLLVTRPYLADDGQPWEPSPYWEQLCRQTGARPQRVRPQDALPPDEAASWPEFLSAVAHGLSQPDKAPTARTYARHLTDDSRWQFVQAGARVLAARLAAEAQGPHEGDLSHLGQRLARAYGPHRPWSASRLETYAACAFAFFAAYALGLEPRRPVEAGYDVRQLGNMYHAVLEQVFRRAKETGEAPADLLPQFTGEVFDTAPEVYGFRPTPLWAQQRREHERILATTVEALVEAAGEWEPAHFEPPFGLRGVPPLELTGPDGETLRLRGYIDRVDVNCEGELRLLDYKSGSTAISARDLELGKRVQLALYALAARDLLEMGKPAAGMYWHIGSAKPSSLKLERYPGGIEAALDVAVAHALSCAAGARQGRFAPQPPEGGCPAWCPATDFCWRYAPRGW